MLCSTLQPDYASIQEHCNIWRNFDDIDDSWASLKSIIDFYKKYQQVFQSVAKPGAFHDPDMVNNNSGNDIRFIRAHHCCPERFTDRLMNLIFSFSLETTV